MNVSHETIEINQHTPLSVVDEIGADRIGALASSVYGLGNHWHIDWERFYESLETEGWDMQDLGGKVDEKIRRIGRKYVKENC